MIECDPAVRLEIGQIAVAVVKATFVQIALAPFLNVTFPVGDRPLTVAVNVTLWPNVLGLVALTSVVEVAALLTCCATVFEVDVALFASPLYATLIECEPPVSVVVVQPALPLLKVTAEQMTVTPSLNVAVPVGDWPVTVAVNVTLWPKVLGFGALISVVELVALSTCCTTVFDADIE